MSGQSGVGSLPLPGFVAALEDLHTKPKTISEDIVWHPTTSTERVKYEFEVEVKTPEGDELRLFGWANRGGEFSFTLSDERKRTVRRFDSQHGWHRNPDGRIIPRGHKHRPSGTPKSPFAYPVTDINPDNPDEAFHQFLREESITLASQYNPVPPFQMQTSLGSWQK